MVTLVVGGSGSGKSGFAEEYLDLVSLGDFPVRKYYIATMQACDGESRERVKRHRRQREGKGFHTIEQPVDIEKAAEKMEGRAGAALLECVSNLVANEMFAGRIPGTEEAVSEKILRGIAELRGRAAHLVVVSNNVFEDERAYGDTTMAYIRAMARVNEKLAAMADEVVEVVAGIPVVIKKGSQC